MRSRRELFKHRKLITLGALTAVLAIVFFYLAIKGVMTITSSPRVSAPAETLVSEHPLDAQVYFNNEVGVEGTLSMVVEQIDAALHSVEIAMFSFNHPDIKEALYAADKRGVDITLVLDASKFGQHDLFLPDLPQSITRIEGGRFDVDNSLNTVYMHHKFMIVDRGYPSEKLTTGSLNFTTLGERYNQSFLLVTRDTHIVGIYGKEFDLLKKGISGIKKLAKRDYNPWAASISYPDSFLDIWFSPGFSNHSLKYRILDHIKQSEESIDIIMWDFTDTQIESALIAKAREGVLVKIITEDKRADTRDSVIPHLLSIKERENLSNLEIILDTKLSVGLGSALPGDFTPFIHHHSMIVDNKLLIAGSGNWSLWGFYQNDENALVTDNTRLIEEFRKTFNYFYFTLR